MNGYTGDLIAQQLDDGDGRHWRIYHTFTYRIGEANGTAYVRVPKGFVTDFASIPRGLWNLWPPASGKYAKAAVVHDVLYRRGYVESDQHRRYVTRSEADAIFKEAMGVSECGWFTTNAIYLGVRLGGSAAWDKYRSADSEAA